MSDNFCEYAVDLHKLQEAKGRSINYRPDLIRKLQEKQTEEKITTEIEG